MGLATSYYEDGRVITTSDIYDAFEANRSGESLVRAVRLVGEFVMDRQLFCNSRLIAVDAKAATIRGYWTNIFDRTMFYFRNQDAPLIEIYWDGGLICPDRVPDGIGDNAIEAFRIACIDGDAFAVINNLTMKNLAGGLCFSQSGGSGSGLAVVANCRFLNGYGDRTVTGLPERDHSQGMFTMGLFDVIDMSSSYDQLGHIPGNPLYPKTIFNQNNYFCGRRLRSLFCSHSHASHTGIVCATGDSFLFGNSFGGNGVDVGAGHKDHPYKAHVRVYAGDHSEGQPVFDIDGQRRQGCYSVDAAASCVIVGPTYNVMDPSLPMKDDWAFLGISKRGVKDHFGAHNFTVAGRNLGLSFSTPLNSQYRFTNVDTSGCVVPLRCGWAETGPDSPIGGVWIDCNVPGYTSGSVGPSTPA